MDKTDRGDMTNLTIFWNNLHETLSCHSQPQWEIGSQIWNLSCMEQKLGHELFRRQHLHYLPPELKNYIALFWCDYFGFRLQMISLMGRTLHRLANFPSFSDFYKNSLNHELFQKIFLLMQFKYLHEPSIKKQSITGILKKLIHLLFIFLRRFFVIMAFNTSRNRWNIVKLERGMLFNVFLKV